MINLDCWKEYADTYVQVARAMIEKGEFPPGPQALAALTGIRVSRKKHVSPPKIDKLAWLLPQLPPIVARNGIEAYLPITSKTLNNADSAGKGPRVRYLLNGKVAYPAAYLLEWMEDRGVEVEVAFR